MSASWRIGSYGRSQRMIQSGRSSGQAWPRPWSRAPSRRPFRAAAATATADGQDVIRWSKPIASKLPQIVLSGESEAAAERLLRQWVHFARLSEAGLSPANAVLLKGPSGVGKTLFAQHIAARMDLPLASDRPRRDHVKSPRGYWPKPQRRDVGSHGFTMHIAHGRVLTP